MSKANKILLVLVILLVLILAGLIVWQKWGAKPTYSAVYLRTGDLYFGKMMAFPSFGLKNVYTISVNQQDQQNPLSIQKFSNVFWGPEDYLKINRSEVVWITKLKDESQLVQLLKTNPNLLPQNSNQGQNQQPENQPGTQKENPSPETSQ
jgi:hypothetical protein